MNELDFYSSPNERKQTESEARFAATFNQAAVGMAHVNLDGTVALVNQKFCDIVGYNQDELLKLHFRDITHLDDIEEDLKHVQYLLDNKISTYSMEKRYIRKNGTAVWSNLTVSLVRNSRGEPRYFIAVIEDINQRKKAESELQVLRMQLEEKVRFRTQELEDTTVRLQKEIAERKAVETDRNRFYTVSRDAMIVYGMSGTFRRFNAAFCEMLGYSEEELVGQTPWGFVHPEDISSTKAVLSTLRANQFISNFENRYIRKTGETIYISWTATYYAEDDTTYAIGRDITEVKAKEKLIADERAKANAASKMHALGRMAAGVAHEINNPLTVVYGQAYQIKKLIADGVAAAEPQRISYAAEQIEKMAMRIVGIIKGLKTFARDGANDPLKAVPLKSIIEDTLSFCQGKMATEGIDLKISDLPDATEVLCRPVQISQVLLNFLNNARDAVELVRSKSVKIDFIERNGKVGIVVEDNGPGVDIQDRQSLFEPFFTTKIHGKGTGLGLNVSRKIVESHGGEIFFEPAHPNGARFGFLLPKIG